MPNVDRSSYDRAQDVTNFCSNCERLARQLEELEKASAQSAWKPWSELPEEWKDGRRFMVSFGKFEKDIVIVFWLDDEDTLMEISSGLIRDWRHATHFRAMPAPTAPTPQPPTEANEANEKGSNTDAQEL